MSKQKIFQIPLLFVLIIMATCCSAFSQQTNDDEALKKGIYHFRQESYDEALDVFKRLFRENPDSSLTAYYLGLTYKRMENYVEAQSYLERSLEMKPKIKGALMELIDLLYRLGEYDEAKRWIALAEEEGIRPAQSKFLKGLTYQKSGEYEEAIQAFKDAKDLDDRLTQSADYQLGVCYLKLRRLEDAREAFKDVFSIDPYSEIGEYAEKYMDALDSKIDRSRPFHFTTKAGFEYDSNVVLKPDGSSVVTGITDQDDTKQTFDLGVDYTFKTEDMFASFKTAYAFHLAKQNDFGSYDIIANSVSAQLNLSFDRMLVTFPVNYNHTMVDEENYLQRISAGNINNLMVGDSQMAQFGAIYAYDDYMRQITTPGEDRSGPELTGTAGWFWFFMGNKGFFNLRYSVVKDWADGNNWEFLGHKAAATLLYPFWEKFKLTLSGNVYFQEFDNTHTVYNKKREDQTYTAGSGLSYELMKNIELQLKYSFIKEQSNLNIYRYNRHVVGVSCQYKY